MGDSPDKMTYTEQANKRQHCKRLTSFIRLCDYLITNTMHSLGKKSLPRLSSNVLMVFLSRQFGIYPIGSIRRAVETFSNGI